MSCDCCPCCCDGCDGGEKLEHDDDTKKFLSEAMESFSKAHPERSSIPPRALENHLFLEYAKRTMFS